MTQPHPVKHRQGNDQFFRPDSSTPSAPQSISLLSKFRPAPPLMVRTILAPKGTALIVAWRCLRFRDGELGGKDPWRLTPSPRI